MMYFGKKIAEIRKIIEKSFAVSQKLRIFADAFHLESDLVLQRQCSPRCESGKFCAEKGMKEVLAFSSYTETRAQPRIFHTFVIFPAVCCRQRLIASCHN